jgi:hypothetical protein
MNKGFNDALVICHGSGARLKHFDRKRRAGAFAWLRFFRAFQFYSVLVLTPLAKS